LDFASEWNRAVQAGPIGPIPDLAPLVPHTYLAEDLSAIEKSLADSGQSIYRCVRDASKTEDGYQLFGYSGQGETWVHLGQLNFERPRRTAMRLLTGPALLVDAATTLVAVPVVLIWTLGAYTTDAVRSGETDHLQAIGR